MPQAVTHRCQFRPACQGVRGMRVTHPMGGHPAWRSRSASPGLSAATTSAVWAKKRRKIAQSRAVDVHDAGCNPRLPINGVFGSQRVQVIGNCLCRRSHCCSWRRKRSLRVARSLCLYSRAAKLAWFHHALRSVGKQSNTRVYGVADSIGVPLNKRCGYTSTRGHPNSIPTRLRTP